MHPTHISNQFWSICKDLLLAIFCFYNLSTLFWIVAVYVPCSLGLLTLAVFSNDQYLYLVWVINIQSSREANTSWATEHSNVYYIKNNLKSFIKYWIYTWRRTEAGLIEKFMSTNFTIAFSFQILKMLFKEEYIKKIV